MRETFLGSQRIQSVQTWKERIDVIEKTEEQNKENKFVQQNVVTEKRTKEHNSFVSEVPDGKKDKRTQLNCV